MTDLHKVDWTQIPTPVDDGVRSLASPLNKQFPVLKKQLVSIRMTPLLIQPLGVYIDSQEMKQVL